MPPKGDSDRKELHVPNRDYETWEAKDGLVLNYMLTSLSKEIHSQVSSEDRAARWPSRVCLPLNPANSTALEWQLKRRPRAPCLLVSLSLK